MCVCVRACGEGRSSSVDSAIVLCSSEFYSRVCVRARVCDWIFVRVQVERAEADRRAAEGKFLDWVARFAHIYIYIYIGSRIYIQLRIYTCMYTYI